MCEDAVRGGDELAVARLGRIESADEILDSDGAGATVMLTTVDADGQSTFFFFSLRDGLGAPGVTADVRGEPRMAIMPACLAR